MARAGSRRQGCPDTESAAFGSEPDLGDEHTLRSICSSPLDLQKLNSRLRAEIRDLLVRLAEASVNADAWQICARET